MVKKKKAVNKITSKVCAVCAKVKKLSGFRSDNSTKDKLYGWCKVCETLIKILVDKYEMTYPNARQLIQAGWTPGEEDRVAE